MIRYRLLPAVVWGMVLLVMFQVPVFAENVETPDTVSGAQSPQAPPAQEVAPSQSLDTATADPGGQPVVHQSVTPVDAVNIALKNNPSIAARQALVAAAQARVGMARAMTRPRVSTTTYATKSDMSMIVPGVDYVMPQNFSLTPDASRINQNVTLEFPLYTGGRLRGQVKSAQAQQEASVFEVTRSELDVALAVRRAYYEVLLAHKMLDAWQRRVAEAQERVRIAEEAFAAGRIARYDLLRNQTDLAEAQQMVNSSESEIATALADLKSMMGISQASQVALDQELAFQETAVNLEALQAAALQQRPEITAARARIRSAEASLSVAKSAYQPQISAMAMADLGRVQDGEMNESGTESGYLLGVVASLPLYDGGLRRSQVKESQAMIAQMQADEREAILMVGREVTSAAAKLSAAAENVGLTQTAVTAAEENYRVIRLRYEAGRATNVEVLDALASLTRAQTNYAEALYNYNVARDTLTRATGQR